MSNPACSACGRSGPWRRLRHGLCPTCYSWTNVERCGGCGRTAPVNARTEVGAALCQRCRVRQVAAARTGELHARAVAVVLDVEPALNAGDVLAAVARAAGGFRQAVWLTDALDDPDALAGSTTAPRVVDRLVAELQALGAERVEAPRCVRCGRHHRLDKRLDGHRACSACANAVRLATCGRCGREGRVVSRDDDGSAVCSACWKKDPAHWEPCARCGRVRLAARRQADGTAWCRWCSRPEAVCVDCGGVKPCEGVRSGQFRCHACSRRRAPCSRCGRQAKVAAVWASGPVCTTCRLAGLSAKATCEGCGQWRRPDPRHPSGRCSDCVGLPPLNVCGGCGIEERLYTAGRCHGCTLAARLDELLASDSTAAVDLGSLRQLLLATGQPRAALRWIAKPATATALRRLADGDLVLSHAGLDELGDTLAVGHLRAVLVAAGLLPARDEAVARLEAWVAAHLDLVEPVEDRRVVEAFATWWVLRRQRIRAARTDTISTKTARRQIRRAIEFCAFLRDHDRTLATCTQADVDLWLAGPPARRHVRDFLRWAHRHRLCPDVTVVRRQQGWPARHIDVDSHQALVRRLLDDDGLAVVDRLAGLFVACYGQTPARLVRLTLDHVTLDDSPVTIRFGRDPITLPDPVAVLLARLVADRHGRATTADTGQSRWLFPGGQPGRHLHPQQLSERLQRLGLDPLVVRTAALLDLASEVPPAILADVIGLYPNTATRWTRAAGGDWAAYDGRAEP